MPNIAIIYLSLCCKLEKLIPHHFIAKEQLKFISDKKNNLLPQEVLIQLDFSENYAFVAQNAIQTFHFNNDQIYDHLSCCCLL